ncbi:autophagy-related protein 13 isoform X11 [Carcharodon carcharias]|uniref:autophagy-related protein 13 isoform X11 n=1 Tax=Carcharodon carcharias TaxID=13397 RepID=UPI001B7E78DA|nr:autophagy-related protein 13 isoform X11 [Carcharodon carcharias]
MANVCVRVKWSCLRSVAEIFFFTMDGELSPQDKKDLDKFIKFFALKTVQVIVQARLGEKICTRSSSSPTGSDWFNLAIKDIPEVTHEAKKALAGQLPGIGRSMCVEISLKTSEGDSMELETWCLEMNEKCDKEIKVSYTVYNRLSLLLKSLLAITRVTPAYKLSRKQGHDYVILYRIYFGEVQLIGLGDGFQTVRVGMVGTPVGTITLSCAYRTNLAFMSGRATGEDDAGAFPSVEDSQEVCTTSFSTSPPSQLYSSRLSYQPFATLGGGSADLACCPAALTAGVNTAHPHQMIVPSKEGGIPVLPLHPAPGTQADGDRVPPCNSTDMNQHVAATPSSSSEAELLSKSSEGKSATPQDVLETTFTRKVGAFVNKPANQVIATNMDLPFAVFAPKIVESEDIDVMVNPPDSPTPESSLHASLHSDQSSGSSGLTQDEFVMVELKPAFSKDDFLPMDLGTFYREFQNPPQLSSLSIDISAQSMAEDLDSLPEKLAIYEKNMEEFDAFVDTLQ